MGKTRLWLKCTGRRDSKRKRSWFLVNLGVNRVWQAEVQYCDRFQSIKVLPNSPTPKIFGDCTSPASICSPPHWSQVHIIHRDLHFSQINSKSICVTCWKQSRWHSRESKWLKLIPYYTVLPYFLRSPSESRIQSQYVQSEIPSSRSTNRNSTQHFPDKVNRTGTRWSGEWFTQLRNWRPNRLRQNEQSEFSVLLRSWVFQSWSFPSSHSPVRSCYTTIIQGMFENMKAPLTWQDEFHGSNEFIAVLAGL